MNNLEHYLHDIGDSAFEVGAKAFEIAACVAGAIVTGAIVGVIKVQEAIQHSNVANSSSIDLASDATKSAQP